MTACAGICGGEASTLRCPTCLKHGLESYFCGQDCFKKSWAKHKALHPVTVHDPFPDSVYTGKLRAAYPLSARRTVPASIVKPDHAETGIPAAEQREGRTTEIRIVTKEGIEIMRAISRELREILDIAAAAVKPGVTTDEIDRIVHEESVKRGGYPSPLNYYNFPKSCCTSVNEVICHGIPDQYRLQDGDIVNIDVSFYKNGYHSDLNETYYVGDKAKANPDTVRLVETARESMDLSIATVKPGVAVRTFGDVIEKHAKANQVSVVRTYCGHGVNQLFHTAPNIPHYAKNKAVGVCKPGMVFTIEPMLNLGSYRDKMWPDNWTSATVDGKWSAQFEHTLLVTEDGVEILTARTEKSPGGAVARI